MHRICIFLLLLIFKTSFSQTSFINDSLENYINNGMKIWKIPGLSIAIVKDGKIVYLKGYGVTDFVSKEAVNENTLFMIASNTKLFTATALAKLEQDHRISLDDRANKWIPYFRLKDTLTSNYVIIRDLLSHRIGFETFQGDFTYYNSNLNREDVIRKMALIEAPYKFRTTWGYCNAAFVVAGQIIQSAAGKTWENYIQQSILNPLKMNNTKMHCEELISLSNVAKPYTIVNDSFVKLEFPNVNCLAPAVAMSSSAKDMSNWLITQIDLGKFEGNQVIPEMAIKATRQPHSIVWVNFGNNQKSHFHLYGLGLGINDRAGKVVFSHSGGVDGFSSSVTIVPEENLGIVILTNTDQNYFYQDLADEILDSYLTLPYSGYSYKSLQYYNMEKAEERKKIDSLKALVLKNHISTKALSFYTGEYSNELYGDVSIRMKNNSLVIHFSHHPQLTGNLEFIKENNFLCTYSLPTYGIKEIPFYVKNGKVKGFKLTVNDFVELTPYYFTKK